MVVPLREFDRPQNSQDVMPVVRRDAREEFANNSESRCPVLLLLDTSSSMTNLMERLTRGTQVMVDTLAGNSLAAKRAEIAIVTFGGGVYLPPGRIDVSRQVSPLRLIAAVVPGVRSRCSSDSGPARRAWTQAARTVNSEATTTAPAAGQANESSTPATRRR